MKINLSIDSRRRIHGFRNSDDYIFDSYPDEPTNVLTIYINDEAFSIKVNEEDLNTVYELGESVSLANAREDYPDHKWFKTARGVKCGECGLSPGGIIGNMPTCKEQRMKEALE